ncbi:protein PHYTOCHROME KINASE SUBSTRATE 2 [Prunus yedoensis var. nudiflora]|uniref:Protein PHYTOCHROME KINASE SUBSTRATE 2 n=1 Tax=Prunus yedoensis var. nudiflora TaxID=2094558 RepID=A0A314ZJS4_PRUYE|nr:protein PHYTOCHROME KINASE SUBSTRATE 2 [Prunus yedoensis var. nudiflora]
MAMVTLKSTSKANLSQTFPCDNNKNRDASFSSYLSSNEETLVCKLVDQSGEEHNNHLATKKEEDEEIGVFGAEKYFNGVMDEETSPKGGSSSKNYPHNKEKRVQPGTPSVRSESSWNSQTSLLQSRLRNPYQSNTSKAQRQKKNFFASLGCKCYCSDKNSVDVDEHVGEISFKKNNGAANSGTLVHGKASTTSPINNKPAAVVDLVGEALVEMNNSQKLDKLGVGLSRENCFTFPSSKPGMGSLPVKMPFQEQEEEEAEKVRKSLEVFGSPVFEKRNRSLGLDKRLTMLPWDEFPAKSGGVIFNNESDSDASSDLFEIESLTGKANPCMTPTTCYAPSEASIEWSVATASVADFSAMSDSEDLQRLSPMKMVPNNTRNAKTRMNKEIPRHRSAALLGCKSQKAVKIAGDAHKTYHHEKSNFDQQMMRRNRPESFVPATRFQAETSPNKLTGFDSRVQGQHALAAQSRSHSPHASHLLFM